MNRSWVRVLVVLAVCSALALGVVAVMTEVQAAACRCPSLWAPVQCDHGKIYPNQCWADCRHAKNCVPIGGTLP